MPLKVQPDSTTPLLNKADLPDAYSEPIPNSAVASRSLNTDQVEKYMQSEEYQRYLDIYVTNLTHFKDFSGNFQPFYWKSKNAQEIIVPSLDQIYRFCEKLKQEKRIKDKCVLLDCGIEELPKNNNNWQEYKYGSDINNCVDLFLCFFPFCKNKKMTRTKPFHIPYLKREKIDQKTKEPTNLLERRNAIIDEPSLNHFY